ncbi:TonB-dependent receptor [Sulfurospirillum sp.]|uniref:TonB-dependent receptor n=1 Tax=Sulfurospirillum sp. TaxID=2053622 RepID=UPI002FDE7E8D
MKNTPLSWIATISFCSVSAFAAQSILLEPVAVEGEKEPSTPLTLRDTKTPIKVEESASQPTTLNEALKNEFFISYKKAGDYNSEPYIRGRGVNGVPIYLEGMRINAAHPDSTSIFNMIDAEEVDVYRGANGANVGMGAMNGAVVVKFKEPKFSATDEFQASSFISAKTSLFSETGYTTAIGTTLYNQFINLSVSGSVNENNNYKNGAGDEVLHSDSDSKHYNIATAVKTGDDSYIYGRFMRDKSSSGDPLSRYQQSGIWYYTDHPNDDAKSYFVGFKKGEWYGLSDIDFQIFKNDLHYNVNTNKEANTPNNQELFRESNTKGAKLSAKKELDEHQTLSLTTTYSKMEITNGVRNWSGSAWGSWMNAFGIKGGDYTDLGIQLSDDIKYDKAFYTLAVGYDNVKRNVASNVNTTALTAYIPSALSDTIQKINTDERDNLLSFSAKAGYEISPAFIPYIKLSNAERTPYFNEAYGNNPSNGTQIPNQTLENEKVWGIDVGLDGKYDRFYYTSALYYQRYSNYIELIQTAYKTKVVPSRPIKQYTNLDDAYIYGAEAMLGYGLGNDLFAEASYLYTYGQNEDANTPLAFIAPQKLTLSLAQKRNKGLSWRVEEVFVDDQSRVSIVNGEIATPGYSLTNASISYGFSKVGVLKNAVLSFELNNIFDKSYREHLDKVSSTAWYLPDNPGINGVLSLKANF